MTQKGVGVTILSGNSSYSGGTNIARGELQSAKSAALGTGGTITMTGGELLATAAQALAHDFNLSGVSTIAVSTGSTLILNSSSVNLQAGTTYIGDATHAGTIVWNVSTVVSTDVTANLQVRDGTLKIGTGLATALIGDDASVRIDTGGTLDLVGHGSAIANLTGAGILTDSGAAATIFLDGPTNYAGVITGHIVEVDIEGVATLGGHETFTGKAVIENGKALTLSGLFGEDVEFTGAGTLTLTKPSWFTGTVEDFQSGSTIDLKNITTGAGATLAYDTNTGVLTVKSGAITDTVKFGSGLVLGNFATVSDGSGGTDINWQTPPPAPAALASATPVAASVAPATAKVPATNISAPLVDAMASFHPPYTAATALILPTMPVQPALAFAH